MDVKLTRLNPSTTYYLVSEIKKVVNTFMNSKLSGEVKRQKVESIVMPIFASTILPVLINVSIEIAVAVLKSQIKTES